MHSILSKALALACACLLLLAAAAPAAAERRASPLVDTAWLQRELSAGDVLLIDASSTRSFAAGHIPGAVSVDLYRYGPMYAMSAAQVEERLQSWGARADRRIVVYDEGASMTATWLFHELYYHGFPLENLFVLDGGLAKWQASGGAVTKEPGAPPAKGTFRVASTREEERVRLNAFIAGSGDRGRVAIVEALEPGYHYGGAKFFDRGGHVPNALMLPVADFFNADKTFKSGEEIARMAAYLGIRPDEEIYTHCGGGIAATVPYFALKFVAGNYPHVKVYKESQLEWLQDERGLPFWTYDAPYLKREAAWVHSWNNRMLRMFGATQLTVIDVRPPGEFEQNHVPYALNIPADVFGANVDAPAKLAELLGPAGVNPAHEAVIVSAGGLNERSALAFLALERAGQKKVSLLMGSVDDWGLGGFTLTKQPTIVGAPKAPQDFAVPPAQYRTAPREGIAIHDARATRGVYPKVFIASGKSIPARAPEGKVIHVPYTDLVNENGTPKPASEIWSALAKAGVPRYAEIICYDDKPGAAAVNYVVLKLMGFPDVKVMLL